MTDPPRFSDEKNSRAAWLVRAGQREAPVRGTLEKTLTAVSAGAALLGGSQGAAAAAGGKVATWTLAKWLGTGLVAGLATVGGAEVVRTQILGGGETLSQSEPPKHMPSSGARAPMSAQNKPAMPLPGAKAMTVAPSHGMKPYAGPMPSQPDPAMVRPTEAVGPPSPVPAEMDEAVAIEVRLLDEARRALADGRPRAALDALSRYQREAPSHRLAPEAWYLEMEAHLSAGNRAAARSVAASLIQRFPTGPHAARARWVQSDLSVDPRGLTKEEAR